MLCSVFATFNDEARFLHQKWQALFRSSEQPFNIQLSVPLLNYIVYVRSEGERERRRSLVKTAFRELGFNGRIEFRVRCLESTWTTLRLLVSALARQPDPTE